MSVYVAMVCDRHTDPEPFVFTTAEAAIAYARRAAHENARHPENYEEQPTPEGWLFYATYSVESDSVWVLEREVLS